MADDKQMTLVDSISSLPDEILQHILCFLPTIFVIRTSVLSKRWRHVWCDTPSLSFEYQEEAWINETLNRYTAQKMMSFHLRTNAYSIGSVDKWIGFAMSRNAENLLLGFRLILYNDDFEIPDFFYNNSFVKQLTVELHWRYMNPTCSVSWTSLKKLTLSLCKLPDESIVKILSGCPILESLTLDACHELRFLDLSKYPSLTTLRVEHNGAVRGPVEIVAPHIHCLKLMNYLTPCTLVDVSSLTQARVDIYYSCVNPYFNAYLLQVMMLTMLEKLQNVEKLTLGENFLQILSLAEICGFSFPMLKMKSVTLKTSISQYVIRGIEKMLQNSPDLKKITLHIRSSYFLIPLDEYLDSNWRSYYGDDWNEKRSDVNSNHVVSYMELVLENAEALVKLVVRFEGHYHKFKELLPTLSNKNNVSIVLSTKPSKIDESGE